MPKFSEGTWWDGYVSALNEFFENVDEFEIFDIIEGLKIDKSGAVMEYLQGIKGDMLDE